MIGDPLEIEMFKNTGWILDEDEERNSEEKEQFMFSTFPKIAEETNDGSQYQLRLVKRFDFASELQRMSAIAK